jgi:hypothetical protein
VSAAAGAALAPGDATPSTPAAGDVVCAVTGVTVKLGVAELGGGVVFDVGVTPGAGVARGVGVARTVGAGVGPGDGVITGHVPAGVGGGGSAPASGS